MTRVKYCRILLVTCSFLLSAVHVSAQYVYQEFVKEGKVWIMSGISHEGITHDHDFRYLIQGDTLIGGEAMKKVYLEDEVYYNDNSLHYIAAVREENRQVYITYAGNTIPILLYDFSVVTSVSPQSRLVITYDDNYALQISRAEFLLINSTPRYWLRGNRTYPPDVSEAIPSEVSFVEGIGSIEGMDPFQYRLWKRNRVQTCIEDGACIYYGDDLEFGFAVNPTYCPLLKNRRKWETGGSAEVTFSQVCMLGDTVFHHPQLQGMGWMYHKVYRADSQAYGDDNLHYQGAVREEGTRIYYIPDGKSENERQLLYDFGLKPGEQAEVGGCTVRLIQSDSIMSEGRKYNRLLLHKIENGVDTGRLCYWTEGIGSSSGLLQPLVWEPSDGQPLVVCDEEDKIYDQSDVSLTTVVSRLQMPSPVNVAYYDLLGRRTQQPTRGIYIRDGRKVVVK